MERGNVFQRISIHDDEVGNFPGFDRAGLIVQTVGWRNLGGFSSDLYILNENSRSASHDGKGGASYQTLQEGTEYDGYYSVPFPEITGIFREMEKNKWPEE